MRSVTFVKGEQRMRVVFDTADNQRFATVLSQHFGEIRVHFESQYLVAKKRKTVLG
jgi:hypothetical protein